MASLTKALMSRHLEDFIGLEPEIALSIVECFFDEITESLVKSEEVNISGLGKFSVRQKSARPGLNPKTKAKIPVKARRVGTFSTSSTLRKKLNQLSL